MQFSHAARSCPTKAHTGKAHRNHSGSSSNNGAQCCTPPSRPPTNSIPYHRYAPQWGLQWSIVRGPSRPGSCLSPANAGAPLLKILSCLIIIFPSLFPPILDHSAPRPAPSRAITRSARILIFSESVSPMLVLPASRFSRPCLDC
jgi:hypothetical protein